MVINNNFHSPYKTNESYTRNKFSLAQIKAETFDNIIDENEVVQWMTSLNPELFNFSHNLMIRGYNSLDDIAFLVEEDIHVELPLHLKNQVLKAIVGLRQDLYRM